jgi:exodeoxyribonuclease VII large subunit
MEKASSVLSVSQVNEYLKILLDSDRVLSNVYVRGEISNFTVPRSGHLYFTLKDEDGQLKAVMFRFQTGRLLFRPEDGMKVIVHGKLSVYGPSGQYQLYVDEMQPDGVGSLALHFEQLKRRLHEEGLFDPNHKKPLPRYPERVALVTSPTGAAVRDMIRILGRRWPMAEVIVCPVRVQGEGAAEEIADMLDYVDKHQLADVIITGRGGGSMEDLWAFNEEVVARAIWRCQIPVISAVGHEPDVTIADYVADVRAATPSNGAELAVRDSEALQSALRQLQVRMEQAQMQKINRLRQRLDTLSKSRVMRQPDAYLQQQELHLEMLRQRLEHSGEVVLGKNRQRFERTAAKLDALSPLKVLGRGYAMVTREDTVIRETAQVNPGDAISVSLSDGTAQCTVNTVQRRNKRGKKTDI